TARNTFRVSGDRSLVQTMTELLAFSRRKEFHESRVVNVCKLEKVTDEALSIKYARDLGNCWKSILIHFPVEIMALSLWGYRDSSSSLDDNDDYFTGNSRVDITDLPKSSVEYKDVVRRINSTLMVAIKKVVKVDNRLLKDYYNQNKEKYRISLNGIFQEMQLFHATAERNVESIVTYNFDKNRTVRSKFGRGVSFSPSAEYANRYCNRNVGYNRALILTKVLVGKSHAGSYSTHQPMDGYDTTTGNQGKVYVKYKDNEFYPEYVAYYNSC
ncbi:hypothetical protein L9F63_019175, partial [Diploptera punctata]